MKVFIRIFFAFILFILFYILFLGNKNKNVLNNKMIDHGVGWKNNQSKYSGSELSFSFIKSGEIAFELSTGSKADQGIEILLDDDAYLLSSQNLGTQKLSISVDKKEDHTVTLRHICIFLYDPCQISLKGIYVENGTKLFSYKLHNKIISVLGDSISTIYGKSNYSQVLANNLGYELHNASVMGSTVSNTSGGDNAIKRYRKDMMSFKSDVIIIFIGTNDATKGVPLVIFERDYSKIVSDIKNYNPNGKVFLVGLLPRKDLSPSVIQNYNTAIEQIGNKFDVAFIDSTNFLSDNDFADSVHPSLESQKELARHFQNALSSVLK